MDNATHIRTNLLDEVMAAQTECCEDCNRPIDMRTGEKVCTDDCEIFCFVQGVRDSIEILED